MKLLTMFPPTFALDNRPEGRNGSNMFLFAFFWRGHPHAAAIAAQEVAEARRSALPSLLTVALGAAAMHWLGLPQFGPLDLPTTILADLIGAMIGLLIFMSLPGRSKATNIFGETVECVVESRLYAMTLEEALREGARQLERGYGVTSAYDKMRDRLPAAIKWVESNWSLIEKAERIRTA